MPKFNMYQSLHTTVIGPGGKPVEMQIRTHAMHRTAEYGIAAHWKYKENKNAAIVGPPAALDEMGWLRQLLDWQREAADPEEFLDALRFDLAAQRGLRLHPQGRRHRAADRTRPRSTSPTRCTPRSGTAASAPGSTASSSRSSRTLDNGDTVEIFTSKVGDGRARRRTGWPSSSPRARAPRSASGSPRSAARTRSRPARTPSPRPCARRACPCSA